MLAGKKFTPPVRGAAEVEFLRSATRREGNLVVTKIQVKNMSTAPIPRLTIDEIWYDKNDEIIPAARASSTACCSRARFRRSKSGRRRTRR